MLQRKKLRGLRMRLVRSTRGMVHHFSLLVFVGVLFSSLAWGHGDTHTGGLHPSQVMIGLDQSPLEIDAGWTLEGTLTVKWDPEVSKEPQFVLEDPYGFTYVVVFTDQIQTNPWAFDGKQTVVYGDWPGQFEALLGEEAESELFLAGAISPLNAPEISVLGSQHARSDAFYAELAKDYPAYQPQPKAVAVNPEDKATLGEWGPVIAWPHIPVSTANLPDGRILTFASNQTTAFPVGPEFTYAATWDPDTGAFTDVPHNNHDMFCGHIVMLEDGRVFVNGGRNTVRTTSVFNYQTDSWNEIEQMNRGRWYPSTVYLPTNQVFTAVGSGGGQYPEIWTPGLGWTLLTNINLQAGILDYSGHYEQNWWPHLRVTPRGSVIHTGPTPQMHDFDTSGLGNMTQLGTGITEWYPKHGAVVMYDEGKLLVAGGATSGGNQASTNRAKLIDINTATPVISDTTWMGFARKFHNAVMLPTGEALMIGGNTSGIKFNDSGTVLAAESWDPATGLWTELADMAIPRNYHSVALLLLDGRVFSGGGGLCGNCAANHSDAQIFSPPYLYNPDGSEATRPVIGSAPSQVGHNETFAVSATPGMTKFSLIKMSANTHAVNTDQRFLNVTFTEVSAGQYDLQAHSNPNVLTIGYYMLFAVDASGVPSEAAVVQVVNDPGLNRAPIVTNPGTLVSSRSTPVSVQISAFDPDGDPITFSASGLPTGLSINSGSGLITGSASAEGLFSATVTVQDDLGEAANAQFDWTILPPGVGSGQILREWWTGISGNPLVNLTSDPDFPDNPAGSDFMTSFEAPTNWADNYGTRMRGFLHVPISGQYQFWIASDDEGRLLLGTDDTEESAVEIASVPGWSASRIWDKYPEQQSALISLVAGQRYYIEALQKEGGGGDNLAVAWAIPGAGLQVIEGQYLSPYAPPSPNQPPALSAVADQFNLDSDAVNLQLAATDPDGDSLTYSAVGLPAGLTLNASSGQITGTPTTPASGTVSATVSDGNGGSANVSFEWTVFPAGQASTQFQFVRLVAESEVNGKNWASMAEFNLFDLSGSNLSRAGWTASASSEETQGENGVAGNALDGNASTIWHTEWSLVAGDDGDPAHPHEFIVDLGSPQTLGGFRYLPRSGAGNGTIASYSFHVSTDGLNWGTAVAAGTFAATAVEKSVAFQVEPAPNNAPSINGVADQINDVDDLVSLALIASDPDGDTLTFSADGLPTGLSINAATGQINGSVTAAGNYSVTVTVDDGRGGTAQTSFSWDVLTPISVQAIAVTPLQVGISRTYEAIATGGQNLSYQWNFGDGSTPPPAGSSSSLAHAFAAPGRYVISVTVSGDNGHSVLVQFAQAVYAAHTAGVPARSSSVLFEDTGDGRIWTVNPDNDTVAVVDAATAAKVAEIAVGAGPRAIARTAGGDMWVTNRHAGTVSVIDATALTETATIALPLGSQPYGIVVHAASDTAYVALQGLGTVARIDTSSGVVLGTENAGENPRHLSLTADGSELYVSTFITPKLTGEETASPVVQAGSIHYGGQVQLLDTSTWNTPTAIVLRHSDRQDAEHSGRGIPNYLGAAAISPDGQFAWVPSKQDNILRGMLRDGQDLTHDSTVRSITSRIDLLGQNEDYPARVDHNDAGIATAAAFGTFGSYLFVALEGSRQIAVVEPYGQGEMFRFDVGRAPQGLVLSPDGMTLYVHNFMDRSLSIVDVSDIVTGGATAVVTATIDLVDNEVLSAQVLNGKQLFYDAADVRLTIQPYISCASCHSEGEQDGRTWDFTGFGEGLRNTITLRGRGGTDHGPVHWTANFDEVQDFEGQLRGLGGGLGLMSDSDFHSGTTDQPLGDPKAGLSADLDALAAYVASLDSFATSPFRTGSGALTPDAVLGRDLFRTEGCASCHSGDHFTDSGPGGLHDVGTIRQPTSGSRLAGALTGLDTPTLRGVWATAPYLHDGSAEDLQSAIAQHSSAAGLTTVELDQLSAYLAQVDGLEPAAPGNQSPIITNPGAQAHTVGASVNLTLAASDPDGDPLTFSANILPNGLSLDNATGQISGVVGAAGNYSVTVTVEDGFGGSDSALFDWVVSVANSAPSLDDPGAQTSTVGNSVSLTLSASDPDGDSLTFGATGLPSGLVLDAATGAISGVVNLVGSFSVDVSVSDGRGGSDAVSFTWDVVDVPNQPPSLTSPGPQSHFVGDSVSLSLSASDPDGDTLSFSAGGLPTGLSIDSVTGTISGFVTQTGTFNVIAQVDDGQGGSAQQSFDWTVSARPNEAPSMNNPGAQTSEVGDTVTLALVASDPDGDTLTYSATGLPDGLSVSASTGVISGSPTAAGNFSVEATVDDGNGGTTSVNFSWTVNDPPASGPSLESLRVDNVGSGAWTAVAFQSPHADPVVTCTVRQPSTGLPTVVRLQNVTESGFELRLQNPSDNTLGTHSVFCLAADAGVWELGDGRRFEAATYLSSVTDSKGNWVGESRGYGQTYSNPVVFGQVMTFNDARWSTFWSRGTSNSDPASSSTLYVGKHVAEDSTTTRNTETVGYMVFDGGSGDLDGNHYEVGLGGDSVLGLTNSPGSFAYTFNSGFASAPQFGLATQAAMDGGNGGWAVIAGGVGLSATQIFTAIDEDQIKDSERSHTTEQVSYLVMENLGTQALHQPGPPEDLVKAMETVRVNNVGTGWTTVSLSQSYVNPVAACTPWYGSNAAPAVVRMRNVSATSLEIRLQVPGDGTSTQGDIHCLVVEEGQWQLPDGRRLEAQRLSSTVTDRENAWSAQAASYGQSYVQPVVLGQVMTANDPEWSTFWAHGGWRQTPPDASTLFVGKHVAEDSNITRSTETLGVIVIEAGSGTVASVAYATGLSADTVVGIDDVSTGSAVSYTQSFASSPQVGIATQAAMDGNNGSWAVFPAAGGLNTSQMLISLDEDQVRDTERAHTTEQVSYIVFGQDISISH